MNRKISSIVLTIMLILAISTVATYAYVKYQSTFTQHFPPLQSHFTLSTDGTPLPDTFNATGYWLWNSTALAFYLPLTITNDGNATFTPTIAFYPSDAVNWTESVDPAILTSLTVGSNENLTVIVTPLSTALTGLDLNITVSS